jgi:hypothetical protein
MFLNFGFDLKKCIWLQKVELPFLNIKIPNHYIYNLIEKFFLFIARALSLSIDNSMQLMLLFLATSSHSFSIIVLFSSFMYIIQKCFQKLSFYFHFCESSNLGR